MGKKLKHNISARLVLPPILIFMALLSWLMPITAMQALVDIGDIIKKKWAE